MRVGSGAGPAVGLCVAVVLAGCSAQSHLFTMQAPPPVDLKDLGVETIGVPPFSWPDGNGEQVAELFSSQLAAGGHFTVVERAQLDVALKRQGIGRIGVPDEKAARRLGRTLWLDALLSGKVILQPEQARSSCPAGSPRPTPGRCSPPSG
jgi:hypothetical protein